MARTGQGGGKGGADRAARLKAALKANIARRKAPEEPEGGREAPNADRDDTARLTGQRAGDG